LKDARWKKFEAKEEVEEKAFAAQAMRERISALEGERVEAIRADVQRQIEETEQAMLADCAGLDDGIARLVIARDAIYSKRDKLLNLAQQIGGDVSRYQKIPTHLSRSVAETLFPREGGWMPRATRDVYQQPFSKLLESLFRSEENWQDVSSEILSTTDAKRRAS
jgi:hypothetical protein